MPQMSDVAGIAYLVIDGFPPPVVPGTADVGVLNDIISEVGRLVVVGTEIVLRIDVFKIEKDVGIVVFVSTCAFPRQFADLNRLIDMSLQCSQMSLQALLVRVMGESQRS